MPRQRFLLSLFTIVGFEKKTMQKFAIPAALFLAIVSCELAKPFETTNCARKVNKIRSETAEKEQISNMNRLDYDVDLEARVNAQLDGTKCADFNGTVQTVLLDAEVVRDNSQGLVTSQVTEFINRPGKSRIACIRKICAGPDDPLVLVTDLSAEPKRKGKPGTGCPSGKVTEESGLCRTPRKLTTLAPTDTPTQAVQQSATSSGCLALILMPIVRFFNSS
ncbi:unnamed protein product [Caenorhabditis sp. 36 PRJEB53466]|nr:unnamed protein product [Caenorhabditis sp. 36 PRJEB53466]